MSRRCRCISRAESEAEQLAWYYRHYQHPWDLVHVLSYSTAVDPVFVQALESVSGVDRVGHPTERFQP